MVKIETDVNFIMARNIYLLTLLTITSYTSSQTIFFLQVINYICKKKCDKPSLYTYSPGFMETDMSKCYSEDSISSTYIFYAMFCYYCIIFKP